MRSSVWSERSLHAHRGLARLVRSEPRNLQEAVAVVEGLRRPLLVARLQPQQPHPASSCVSQQCGHERVSDAGAAVLRLDEEALELSEALTLQLKTGNADEQVPNSSPDEVHLGMVARLELGKYPKPAGVSR